jgi:hypothetical protein
MRLDSSRLHFRGGIRNGDVKFQIESHYDAGPTRFVLHSQPKKDDNSWFSLNEINSRLENILRERPSIQQVTFEYCLRPNKDPKYQAPGADAIYDISLAMWQIQREVDKYLKLLSPPDY